MEPLKRLASSLTFRCLACIIGYAAAIALIASGMSSWSARLFEDAFPSMDSVLAHYDELAGDRFEALGATEFKNCQIIVYDRFGTTLYASSPGIAEKIGAKDVSIINDYEDGSFYEVFLDQSSSGGTYRILRCTRSSENAEKRILGSCLLDENLNVVEGDLFGGRTLLTEREFNLIKGLYEKGMTIERCDYVTDDGQQRTLVLIAPIVTDATYQQVVEQAGRLWLLAAPAAVGATAAAVLYLARAVRRGVAPLDRAITARKRGAVAPAAENVPAELRPTLENFNELMQRLDDAKREQQRIVADISHDLKTPLTVIRGYAQAFCDGRVPPERELACHRAISERAVAASNLLDELFSYTKVNHPEFSPSFERADLCEHVRLAAIAATPNVESAGCTIDVELPEDAVPAQLDTQLFQRALLNLIDNACQHNDAGTRICLSCAGRGGTARLSVADTGSGFDPEIAAHAFEPFVTENAERAAGKGTGLGLAIVQRVAELHGGSVQLACRPRAPFAAEVVITLPTAQ